MISSSAGSRHPGKYFSLSGKIIWIKHNFYQFVYSRINNLKFKILQQSYKIYIKYNIIDKIK